MLLLTTLLFAQCFSRAGGIRTVAPTDDPTRFGGSTEGGFRDGPGEVARYYHPQGLAVSPDGKEVYVVGLYKLYPVEPTHSA
jgi:DNA-binding beta-propeller fold protein YncE